MFVEQIYAWPTFSPLEHCRLKNSHNLETESYIFVVVVVVVRMFRTSSLGDSISSDPQRIVLRRKGEEVRPYSNLQQRGQVV